MMKIILLCTMFVVGAFRTGAILLVGDTCSVAADCAKLANSVCVNSKCTCSAGYYNYDGEHSCTQATIHDQCPDDGSGDAFCSAAITNSICDATYHYCTCKSGHGFVFTEPSTQECKPALTGGNCINCTNTGGTCYDSNEDGIADTCGCRKYFTSSNGNDSLVTGCDQEYTYTDGRCAKNGSVKCIDPNSECKPSVVDMSVEYSCACKLGYIPVFVDDDLALQTCVRKINKDTDPACTVCESNGGSCFDFDDDNVADGCQCTQLYTSSSNSSDAACDTNHVQLQCTTSEMQVCVDATIDYNQYTAEILKVYAEGYENDPECNFANVAGLPPTMATWCISLHYNSTKCGLKTVETAKLVSFSDWFLIRVSGHRQMLDVFLYSYCSYDKVTHTYSGIQEMTEKKIVATEGLHVSPVLSMSVADAYGINIELQGVRLYDDIKLKIQIVDNKAVYTSLRAEICVVSNMLSLEHPQVQTSIFIIDACAVDSMLSKATNFYPDPNNAVVTISTGYFPAPKFLGSDFVYFQCAVKVCLEAADCAPVNCAANRRRRSVGTVQTGPLKLTSAVSLRSDARSKRSLAGQALDGAAGLTQTVIGCAVRDDAAGGKTVNVNQRAANVDQSINDYAEAIQRMAQIQELVKELKSAESDPAQFNSHSSNNLLIVVCIISSSLVTLIIAILVSFICFVLPSYRKGCSTKLQNVKNKDSEA